MIAAQQRDRQHDSWNPAMVSVDAVTYRLASPIPTPEEWLMAQESAAETWVREVPDLAAWAWEHYQPQPKRPAWINRPTVEEAVQAYQAQRLAEEVAEAACEGCKL